VLRAPSPYADDGLVVDLILIADCGEDARTVLNGDEPELEVEVVNVIGFEVIPYRETVQKDHYLKVDCNSQSAR
jgi:hypothetical protein